MKNPNVYLVTVKIIPKGNYKPIFKRGICFAYSEKQASDYVKVIFENDIEIYMPFTIEITKVTKTHGQFVLNSVSN